MAGAPLTCPACLTTFESTVLFSVDPRVRIDTFEYRGSGTNKCPTCGAAVPLEGGWKVIRDSLTGVLSLPRGHLLVVQHALNEVVNLNDLQRGLEIIQALPDGEEKKHLGEWLRNAASNRQVVDWALILTTTLSPFLATAAMSDEPESLTPEQIQQLVETVVEQMQDQEPPEQPGDTPPPSERLQPGTPDQGPP